LHVGGVQDAITVLAPSVVAEAVPTLPKMLLVDPAAPTEAGFVDDQVSGTPVRVMPAVSTTVAFNVVEVPVLTKKELPGFPTAVIEIDCAGQVVN